MCIRDSFHTHAMDRRETAIWHRFHAASLKRTPIVDPPELKNSKRLIREDTLYCISLAFPKIFQDGKNDYWAYKQERQNKGLPLTLEEWFRHTLLCRDGRAASHPRYIHFVVNTCARMKALKGRNFFANRVTGNQANVEYMPDQMARMDKAAMRRSLCAYETSMPGSASEKLQMRADLEAMLNQTEEESWARASADMPQQHASLRELSLIHI